ncbi:MAG: NERD domain-containing protein [Oscillospiraceae bacterium]|nr:NERD domain-containing protein [Oscillospiraceae bacterium]
MQDTLFIFTAVCLFIAVLLLLLYLRREMFDTRGKSAPRATARVLSQFAFLRRFKVLSNVNLGDGLAAENILIGYFGILLIHTLGAKGNYYGTLSGEQWSVVLNDKRTHLQNPVLLMQRQSAAIRTLLSKKKLYNIPIECIVYISNKSSKTTVSITNNGEILMPGKLSGYLDKTKFEKDLGLDIDQIVKSITDSDF